MGTLVVVIVLAVIIGLVIWKLIRDKKAGKRSCGCDCANCSGCSYSDQHVDQNQDQSDSRK